MVTDYPIPQPQSSGDPVYGIPPDLVRGPSAMALPMAGEANWGMSVFGVEQLRRLRPGPDDVIHGQ